MRIILDNRSGFDMSVCCVLTERVFKRRYPDRIKPKTSQPTFLFMHEVHANQYVGVFGRKDANAKGEVTLIFTDLTPTDVRRYLEN